MNVKVPGQLYYVACVFPRSEREADGEIYFYFIFRVSWNMNLRKMTELCLFPLFMEASADQCSCLVFQWTLSQSGAKMAGYSR